MRSQPLLSYRCYSNRSDSAERMTKLLTEAEQFFHLPNFYWSLERYHAAIAAGVLTEDDRLELLFGKLTPMSPVGIAHGKIVNKISRIFFQRLSENKFTVGVQNPVTLKDDSEPEPDLYVAQGKLESYDHHPYPEDLSLIVEVSDTTLSRDRGAKKVTYARAGIIEYWIIDVFEQRLERYTQPDSENGDYANSEIFGLDVVLQHGLLGELAVRDLFPGA